MKLCLSVALGLSSAGLVGLVIVPGPEKVIGETTTRFPILPDRSDRSPLQHLVFFPNKSAIIDYGQQRVLNDLFSSLASCDGIKIAIRGFASSRPFPPDDDNNNRDLADRRAKAVGGIAFQYGLHPDVKAWPTPDDMKSARKFVDVNADTSGWKKRELLNRRVEVDIYPAEGCVTH